MARPAAGTHLATAVTSIVLAVALASVTFSLLLTPWPTRLFAQMFADEGPSGYSHAEMVEVAEGVLDYALGDDDAQLPRGTDDVVVIDDASLAHLRDCRGLFLGVIRLAVASGAASVVLAAAFCARRRQRLLGRALVAAAALTLAVLATCLVFALADFNTFFNFLHSFFFAADSWYFPADSLMICALPLPFWMGMAVLWALLVCAFSAAYIALGCRLSRRGGARKGAHSR
ncbi:MAG: DUF1461 domain-containing protein [Coriobacteriales bacterium]